MESLQELETVGTTTGTTPAADLEQEQLRRRQSESELELLKQKLETELHKVSITKISDSNRVCLR